MDSWTGIAFLEPIPRMDICHIAFIRDAAGPILQILGRLTPAAQAAAWEDMAGQLEVFQAAESWAGPNTLLLTVRQR